jgi:hypothetical protein
VGHKATTYARSTFELPCRELLVEGSFFLAASITVSPRCGQVSAMFNEQRYGVIIDGREDRRFTVLVARIHIRGKLQQLFFHIGEESLVEP